jgi:hypothetical protein
VDTQHPWTKYEIARLRDEERLLRAQAAMRAGELRQDPATEPRTARASKPVSLLDRIRRRVVAAVRKPARSGA